MKSSNRVKLMAGLKYTIVIGVVMTIIGAVFAFLMYHVFEPSEKFYVNVLWIAIIAFCVSIGIITTIFGWQTATLDENGITFKCIFWKIIRIAWSDLFKVDFQNLETLNSRGTPIYCKWIILYTDSKQVAKNGGVNKKKPPYMIRSTKKNIKILSEYLKRYSNITLNTKNN